MRDTVNKMLPIVADSWDKLRSCDVYRLISSVPFGSMDEMGEAVNVILSERPDLAETISDVANEVHEEIFALGCAGRVA